MNIKAVIDTNVFVSAFWSKNIEAPPISFRLNFKPCEKFALALGKRL